MLFPTDPLLAPLLAEAAPAGSAFGGLLPILLMFAVIYFIVLRPMSKQEKERKKRVEGLAKGDQVVLQGGILGRISNADDPKIAIVEIGTDKKLKIKVLKSKIEDSAAQALENEKDASKAKDDKKKDAKDDESGESKDKDKDKAARKGA